MVGRAHHLVLQAVLLAWWGFHHERLVYRDGVANAQQCCVRGSKTASASEGARGTRTPDIPRRAAEDSFHPLTRPSCSTSSCQRNRVTGEPVRIRIRSQQTSMIYFLIAGKFGIVFSNTIEFELVGFSWDLIFN